MLASIIESTGLTHFKAEDVFRLHPKIRWVGLATDMGEVVFTEMRPDVQSISPEEEDRSFMKMNPLLVFGACERLSQWAGKVDSVVVNYEQVHMHMLRHNKKIIAFSIEKAVDPKEIADLLESIRKLMQ